MDKYIDSKALTYYNNKIKEAYAQKKELPTKTSELINDSGFLNSHQEIDLIQHLEQVHHCLIL